MLIILSITYLLSLYHYNTYLSIAIGGVFSWVYWSISIPIWRKWALSKGVDQDELEKWAVRSLLIFRKSNILSKTEINLDISNKESEVIDDNFDQQL